LGLLAASVRLDQRWPHPEAGRQQRFVAVLHGKLLMESIGSICF